jgi:hypothetical protein
MLHILTKANQTANIPTLLLKKLGESVDHKPTMPSLLFQVAFTI